RSLSNRPLSSSHQREGLTTTSTTMDEDGAKSDSDASLQAKVEAAVARSEELQRILSKRDEEIAELRQRITELLSRQQTVPASTPAYSASAAGDSAALKAVETLVCGLLSPVIERLNCLEAASSRSNSESSDEGSKHQGQQNKTSKRKKGQHRSLHTELQESVPNSCSTSESGDKGSNQQSLGRGPGDTINHRVQPSTAAVSAAPLLSTDVIGWFHQVEFWLKIYGVPEDIALPLLISKLPSKDFAWMRFELNSKKMSTWNDVKSAFRRHYNLESPVENQRAMFARRQTSTETCMEYAIQKLQLIEECVFAGSEAEKCELLLESLNDKAKRMYFDRSFTSLDDLLDSFMKFDRASGKPKKPEEKSLKVSNFHEEGADELCKFVKTERQQQPRERRQEYDAARSANDKPRPSLTNQREFRRQNNASQAKAQGSRRKVLKLCLNCKQEGHFVTWCPQPLTQEFLEWQRAFQAEPNVPTDLENSDLVSSGPAGRHQ
ncbi:MAG: hypothetical protein PV344_00070, partial [Anaplasma sp.]|nr:hypothetical protein [Anaplasma sp.]